MTAIFLSFLLLGCADEPATDTSDASINVGPETEPETEGCEVSVRVDAVPVEELPNPSVGDSWTLIMYCDETVLMGPAVLRIHPADLATLEVSTPTLNFVKAGTGEIQYQLGNRKADIPVTIEDAR
jgi:hypothetical protein